MHTCIQCGLNNAYRTSCSNNPNTNFEVRGNTVKTLWHMQKKQQNVKARINLNFANPLGTPHHRLPLRTKAINPKTSSYISEVPDFAILRRCESNSIARPLR